MLIFQFLNDWNYNYVKQNIIANFIIQKLKNKHTFLKNYTNWSKLRQRRQKPDISHLDLGLICSRYLNVGSTAGTVCEGSKKKTPPLNYPWFFTFHCICTNVKRVKNLNNPELHGTKVFHGLPAKENKKTIKFNNLQTQYLKLPNRTNNISTIGYLVQGKKTRMVRRCGASTKNISFFHFNDWPFLWYVTSR